MRLFWKKIIKISIIILSTLLTIGGFILIAYLYFRKSLSISPSSSIDTPDELDLLIKEKLKDIEDKQQELNTKVQIIEKEHQEILDRKKERDIKATQYFKD